MKEKIIEILKSKRSPQYLTAYIIDAEDEDLNKITDDIVTLFEQSLREELIKYEIFCDSLIPFSHKSKDEEMAMNELVDEYLKQRKP